MYYDISTNVYQMFQSQPVLTICLFGVPMVFIAVITYSICSADFTVDREEIYPEDEEDFTDSEVVPTADDSTENVTVRRRKHSRGSGRQLNDSERSLLDDEDETDEESDHEKAD